jgi:hypothetical protein
MRCHCGNAAPPEDFTFHLTEAPPKHHRSTTETAWKMALSEAYGGSSDSDKVRHPVDQLYIDTDPGKWMDGGGRRRNDLILDVAQLL